MGMEGEASDLMIKECIQIAEATAQLAAKAVAGTAKTLKNVAAFFFALSKDPGRLRGKTSMTNFIRNCGGAATAVPIKDEDMKKFMKLARSYGIPCTPVKLKNRGGGIADMLVRPQDASSVNRILERLGYPSMGKEKEAEPTKKSGSRVPQEPSLERRGSGLSSSTETMETGSLAEKPSIRGRMAYFAAQGKETPKAPVGPEIPMKHGR